MGPGKSGRAQVTPATSPAGPPAAGPAAYQPASGRRYSLLIAAGVLLVIAMQFFGTRPALFAIDQYRAHISPHLRGIIQCRFVPTCSYYGRESIRKHGLLIGGAKTAWRLARCGPWTPLGTPDPPAARRPPIQAVPRR